MVALLRGPSTWCWVFLFTFYPKLAMAQVVVANGLGHFHPWNQPANGQIILVNPTQDSLRVLIHNDSLWGYQHLVQIASEVRMPPQSRRTVSYEWMGTDSSSQGTRLLISTVSDEAPQSIPDGHVKVQISTRYAVDLYRGRIADDLTVNWTSEGVRVQNHGSDFWAGTCYSLNGQNRGPARLASGVLRPGDVRIWSVPSNSDGIWLERVDGYVVASIKP